MKNKNKIYFKGAWVPLQVFLNPQLSDSEIKVFWLISSLDNDHKHCFARNDFFCKLLGLAERTIQRSVKNLEEQNYISIQGDNKTGRVIKIDKNYELRHMNLVNKFNEDIRKSHSKKAGRTTKNTARQKCRDGVTLLSRRGDISVAMTTTNLSRKKRASFIDIYNRDSYKDKYKVSQRGVIKHHRAADFISCLTTKNKRKKTFSSLPLELLKFNLEKEIEIVKEVLTRVEEENELILKKRDFTKWDIFKNKSYVRVLEAVVKYIHALRAEKNSDKETYLLYLDYVEAVYDRLSFLTKRGQMVSLTSLSPTESQKEHFENVWIPDIERRWEEKYWYNSGEVPEPEIWDAAGKPV